jgi:hypothetical protein
MNGSKLLRQGLFAVATTLSLGFGAMEALAAPREAGISAACTALWAAKCNDLCQNKGFDYGVCDSVTGQCLCRNEPL